MPNSDKYPCALIKHNLYHISQDTITHYIYHIVKLTNGASSSAHDIHALCTDSDMSLSTTSVLCRHIVGPHGHPMGTFRLTPAWKGVHLPRKNKVLVTLPLHAQPFMTKIILFVFADLQLRPGQTCTLPKQISHFGKTGSLSPLKR